MYPFSAIVLTLMSDLVSPGSIFASLAFGDNCVNGSRVVPVDLRVESSGRYTVNSDGPVLGKFNVSVTKCDVAPESIMICSSSFTCLLSRRLANLRVHLFDGGVLFCCCCVLVILLLSSSVVGSSLSSSSSGVQKFVFAR